MLKVQQRDLLRDRGTVLGRSLIGLLFVISGIGILVNPAMTAEFYTSVGIPMAGLVVWLVIILKIGAGGAIMIGKRVGLASALLIGFTLLATIIAHLDFSDPMQMTQALKNLAIVGGLIYLMSYGPGGSNTRLTPTENDKNGDGIID